MTTWSVHLLQADAPTPSGEIVFAGDVDTQLLGDARQWARVIVVKDPERIDADPATAIVVTGRPMTLPELDAFQPEWSDVPHPPTAEDGPVMVVHVLRFEDDPAIAADTPAEMDAYTRHAALVAAPNGARIAAWIAADATVVGDGRSWHQVRFNAFPSRAAFMAVVLDPARLEAQRQHREVALADTYTMIVRPTHDALAASIPA